MSAPTVRGRPHFNTAGYYVHVRVKIDNDPPPGVTVTHVRAWGVQSKLSKACVKYSGSTYLRIDQIGTPAIPLAWDSSTEDAYDPDNPGSWHLYDPDYPYYRICAEVTLSDQTKLTKLYLCFVWQTPSGSHEYPDEILGDCA